MTFRQASGLKLQNQFRVGFKVFLETGIEV